MKTLIVEDNADDRKILRYYLERHGCDVIDARDGEEGLELAKIHRPSLIISDALMPRMDGFQLLSMLKLDKDTRGIPVLTYTTENEGEDSDDGQMDDSGDEGLVSMPVGRMN